MEGLRERRKVEKWTEKVRIELHFPAQTGGMFHVEHWGGWESELGMFHVEHWHRRAA
jgi:hypothetical protein